MTLPEVRESAKADPSLQSQHPLAAAIMPSASALAATLAALAMLGPFSIDTYLPAFPDIELSLGATAIQVQQTLTVYLLSFSFMILWHGALSDALGRRNVILVSLAVFIVASLGCASAHTIHYLWAFRMLQGISAGAGIVVGRAMVRDVYMGHDAERLMSLVTMIFTIGPAVAPLIGGWIVSISDWRSIFLFIFAYSALLFWYCWYRLPETLPANRRVPFEARSLGASYRSVLGTLRFHLYSGTVSFNFAGLFLYIAAAPKLLIGHLGLSPQQFAWLFVPSVSGVFVGSLLINRMAGRMPVNIQVRIAFIVLVLSCVFNVTYHLFFAAALPWSVISLFFYCIGMSMAAPVVTIKALDLYPKNRGIVASCQSFAQMMLASLVAGVIAPILSASVLGLALGQFFCVLVGLISWRFARSALTAPRLA